jgi:hypothetical protein
MVLEELGKEQIRVTHRLSDGPQEYVWRCLGQERKHVFY